MTESNETLTSEVYSLCDEAIKKIDDLIQKEREGIKNVRIEATKKKKEIVVELAERLDKLIYQKDTISSTILKQLKGRVGKSLIHKCLPAKYKKEHRRKNALKQKNKIRNKINLAPIVALNQQKYSEEEEEKKQKEKVAVMVGAEGRSITQIKEDKESSENESEDHGNYSREDETFIQSSSSKQQQIEQENQFKEYDESFNSQLEYRNRNDINEQDDIIEKPGSLTDTSNKEMITEGASSKLLYTIDKDILPFDFLINRSDFEDYVSRMNGDEIWINGTINTITKKVTHAFGRLIHQNVAGKSSRKDTATTYTAGDRENGQ